MSFRVEVERFQEALIQQNTLKFDQEVERLLKEIEDLVIRRTETLQVQAPLVSSLVNQVRTSINTQKSALVDQMSLRDARIIADRVEAGGR